MSQAFDGLLTLISIFWVSLFTNQWIFGYSLGSFLVAVACVRILVECVQWLLNRGVSSAKGVGRSINKLDQSSKRRMR